jgi:hypothetical protein
MGQLHEFVFAMTSHLLGLGSHAMRPLLMALSMTLLMSRGAICRLLLGLPMLVACTGQDAPGPVSPTVIIDLPDLTPKPQPEPLPAVDGLLEIGTGQRPTLRVLAFYDANQNDKREADEMPLERAGLRLTPVKDGPNGPEKTGPGRIARTDKEGVLLARVPAGMYSLEYVNILSPGDDPNAAQWASAAQERIVMEDQKDKSLNLGAFCQIEAKVQAKPLGVCTPEYDLKPRAFLAAVPKEIQAGGESILRFRADDEAVVTLEPFGVVESFRVTDFFERAVRPAQTTTYILRAKNAYASKEIPFTVEVTP